MSRALYDKYLSQIKYNDDFGHCEVWNNEIEKWLASVPIEYLDKNKRRFSNQGREKQRKNFLAELCVSYYLQSELGWELVGPEPMGKGNHILDFKFLDTSRETWYCEVKNSSWENEVMKRKSDLPTKIARKKQPKHLKNEGGSFSFTDGFEKQIRKANEQFSVGVNNLLVIVPDTFVSPIYDPFLNSDVKEIVPSPTTITKIAFLDKKLSSTVKYTWKEILL